LTIASFFYTCYLRGRGEQNYSLLTPRVEVLILLDIETSERWKAESFLELQQGIEVSYPTMAGKSDNSYIAELTSCRKVG